jgi:hypothetical protein
MKMSVLPLIGDSDRIIETDNIAEIAQALLDRVGESVFSHFAVVEDAHCSMRLLFSRAAPTTVALPRGFTPHDVAKELDILTTHARYYPQDPSDPSDKRGWKISVICIDHYGPVIVAQAAWIKAT